jgi:hypothetical protein
MHILVLWDSTMTPIENKREFVYIGDQKFNLLKGSSSITALTANRTFLSLILCFSQLMCIIMDANMITDRLHLW